MKIRQHRGGLLESMQTVKNIEPTIDAVREYVENSMPLSNVKIVTLEHGGYDDRIDWDYSYVLVDGHVFGMINSRPDKII